jgi:hypothetical protein
MRGFIFIFLEVVYMELVSLKTSPPLGVPYVRKKVQALFA